MGIRKLEKPGKRMESPEKMKSQGGKDGSKFKTA